MAASSGADCIADFQRMAEEKMNKHKDTRIILYFINLFTGNGGTFNESIEAFKRFKLQPRILTAKRNRSTSTTLLGHPISFPVGISPAVTYSSFHPDGDATAGRAAARARTVMILTSVGDLPIEDFGAMVPKDGHYWAQTYLFKDRRNTLHIVRNAERFGFKAIVVTVDSPTDIKSAGHNKDMVVDYTGSELATPAANIRYANGTKRDFSEKLTLGEIWQSSMLCHRETFCFADWDDLAWLKSQTKLPIVVKGVLTAESAKRAASFGVSGILVSAHGGRQLDGVPAPLDALPEIVDAVKDTNVEVYMDGGIRTGNDVVKALALGARAVFIGRPALYGMAVNGEEGIYEVLKILEKELSTCMALCGCSSLSEITRSIVKHQSQFHCSKL